MRSRKLEKLFGILSIITIIIGNVLCVGVLNKYCSFEYWCLLTPWCSLISLGYLVLELMYLRQYKKGVVSSALLYMSVTSCVWVSVMSMLFWQPMYATFSYSLRLGLFILEKVLPILMVCQWLVGPHRRFRKFHVHFALGCWLFYLVVILGLNALGHGVGVGSMCVPYSFLNMEQLGWQILVINLLLMSGFYYLYCWIWVAIDHLW